MANNDLMTLIASDSMTLIGSLRAGACAAWWLPGVVLGRGKLFGDARPTNVLLAACVSPAGFSQLEGIGRSQQIGPSPHPAGPGKDFAKTAVGPQRDLFGTPFGPPFSQKSLQNMQIWPSFDKNCLKSLPSSARENPGASWRACCYPRDSGGAGADYLAATGRSGIMPVGPGFWMKWRLARVGLGDMMGGVLDRTRSPRPTAR